MAQITPERKKNFKGVDVVLTCRNSLGEGPIWSVLQQSLYWTDIENKRLWRYDENTDEASWIETTEKVGSVAFTEGSELLLACEHDLRLFSWDNGSERIFATIRDQYSGVRLNDGRCDRFGRFVVGEFDYKDRGNGRCYRVDPDGSIVTLFESLRSANSICFSPDGRTMYFSDSPEKVIRAYDYDPNNGSISGERIFTQIAADGGLPDGSAVDSAGCLWNAEWGSGRVVRYTPDGRKDFEISLPCTNPSCVAFGGRDLRTLYVTSARTGLDKKNSAVGNTEGGLFALRTATPGLEEDKFRVSVEHDSSGLVPV